MGKTLVIVGLATAALGGLVMLGRDDDHAAKKLAGRDMPPGLIAGGPATVAAAFRRYADVGASWAIAAALDPSDPENARLLGEEIAPLLRGI